MHAFAPFAAFRPFSVQRASGSRPAPGFELFYVRTADGTGWEPFQVRKAEGTSFESFQVRTDG